MQDEMPPEYLTQAQFEPFQKNQSRMLKFLFGNGDPGWDEAIRKIPGIEEGLDQIKTSTKDIQTYIDGQKEKDKKRAEWWSKFQWVVIPIVAAGVLAFFVQFAVFWIRVVPNIPTP